VRTEEFRNSLYAPFNLENPGPLWFRVFNFGEDIVVALSFRTGETEVDSGRSGLVISVGGLFKPHVLFANKKVLALFFQSYINLLNGLFIIDLYAIGEADRLLTMFNEDKIQPELHSKLETIPQILLPAFSGYDPKWCYYNTYLKYISRYRKKKNLPKIIIQSKGDKGLNGLTNYLLEEIGDILYKSGGTGDICRAIGDIVVYMANVNQPQALTSATLKKYMEEVWICIY